MRRLFHLAREAVVVAVSMLLQAQCGLLSTCCLTEVLITTSTLYSRML